MDAIRIRGGNALFGETKIQGSKNAVLPVMAAALLIEDISIIENCPRITDVLHMQKLLTKIGCKVSRFGGVTMEYPGGCVSGKRPIDIHLDALQKMGVSIQKEEETFTAMAKRLTGSVITLPFPSVGATENVILAAVRAKGVTVLQNAAKEPEITALCNFLQKAGALIEGTGGPVLIIQGGCRLHGVQFKVPSDRIVAGTYLFSVLGTGGHIFLRDAPVSQMRSMLKLAVEMGAEVTASGEGLSVIVSAGKKAVPYVKTDVYPGFPTDMQSPLMAVLSTAAGVSVIEETIFEDRFRMALELSKMGAEILTDGKKAVITGVEKLHGCEVYAKELRGGAGLVIAGCMAEGETIVRNRHFIERGYEDICRDYQDLGVNIVTE